jgi:hypothetical protein
MNNRQDTNNDALKSQLEDPTNYVLMPTPFGMVPLSDKTTIEEFVIKTVPGARGSEVETKEIGGALNSVYLLTILKDNEKHRVVVKKFKNWVGFKWFPLALWAIGTRICHKPVSSKSRASSSQDSLHKSSKESHI